MVRGRKVGRLQRALKNGRGYKRILKDLEAGLDASHLAVEKFVRVTMRLRNTRNHHGMTEEDLEFIDKIMDMTRMIAELGRQLTEQIEDGKKDAKTNASNLSAADIDGLRTAREHD